MPENAISIRVQQLGAEEVRRRLQEINQELKQGAPVTKNLKREVSELGSGLRLQNSLVRLNRQAWAEQHNALVTAGRAMSTVAGIARSALAVTTAWSIATLAFGKTSERLREVRDEATAAGLALSDAIARGAPKEEIDRLRENFNALNEEIKAVEFEELQAKITGVINSFAGLAIFGSHAIQGLIKVGPHLRGFTGIMAGLAAASWAAAVPLGIMAGIALTVAAAIAAIITPGDIVQQFFNQFFPSSARMMEEWGKTIDDIFTMHIPNAFIFMANRALDVFDTIIIGGQIFVNHFISIINGMIAAVNRISGAIGLPQIATIPAIAVEAVSGGARIPYLESRNWGAGGAGTFGGSGSTLTPLLPNAARAGVGGTTINININSDGVVTMDELEKELIGERLKNRLKAVGFTGFE